MASADSSVPVACAQCEPALIKRKTKSKTREKSAMRHIEKEMVCAHHLQNLCILGAVLLLPLIC